MLNVNKRLFLVKTSSVNNDGFANVKRHSAIVKKFQDAGFKIFDAVGAFHGDSELYIAMAGEQGDLSTIKTMALDVDAEGAVMVYDDKAVEDLMTGRIVGTWSETDEGKLAYNNYVYLNDQYYTVK
jgi:hypothetical protein